MTRRKIFAVVMLPAVLIVVFACSCGGGTTVAPPPDHVNIDTSKGLSCLFTAAQNFSNIGEKDKEGTKAVVAEIAWNALLTLFAQSCRDTLASTLAYIKEKSDSTTYLYVGPGHQVTLTQKELGVTPPIDLPNCTLFSNVSSDFYLGTPMWISVADPDPNKEAVNYQVDPIKDDSIQGKVADYLNRQYGVSKLAFSDKQGWTVPTYPTLTYGEYLELYVQITSVTYMTGTYEVYKGQQLTQGPAQWSYVTKITFDTGNMKANRFDDAVKRGLCAPLWEAMPTPTP